MTDLKVTQADRDAAASLMPVNTMAECERLADVKVGRCDRDYRVQAFARHRADSQAELVEALDIALAAFDVWQDGGDIASIMALEEWEPKARAALARVKGEKA